MCPNTTIYYFLIKNENVPNTFLLNASLRRLNTNSSKVCHCSLQAGNLQQVLSLYVVKQLFCLNTKQRKKILGRKSPPPPSLLHISTPKYSGLQSDLDRRQAQMLHDPLTYTPLERAISFQSSGKH